MTTRNTKAIDANDMQVQRPRAVRMDEVDTLAAQDVEDLQIVSPTMFADEAEYASFMNQYVTIEIASPRDKNEATQVPVGVNGKQLWLPRGTPVEIRRCFVERLLRSQSRSYATETDSDYAAETGTRIAEKIGTDYPIQIVYDADPRGHEWARMVRLQAC